MNLQAFKDLLQMTESEWESRLDDILRENFIDEAKRMLVDEIVEEVNVEQEIVEAILEYTGIDYE
jgi:hypothetical protein